MEIQGEAFFLINAWMNFLSLALAGALARRELPMGRAALSAGMLAGGAMGLLAAGWQGPWAVILGACLLSVCTFGLRAWHLSGLTLAGGLLLSGFADYLLGLQASFGAVMAASGVLTAGIIFVLRFFSVSGRGRLSLHLSWNGRAGVFPAIRDSGNRLRDGVSGLPVIVVPYALIRKMLPEALNPRDLSTLPRGWRIVRMQTAGGARAAMCFKPEKIEIIRGKRRWGIAAEVAVSDFSGPWALLPEDLFQQKEEETYASL